MAIDNINKTFTFVWKIRNLSSCSQGVAEFIDSPLFIAKCLDESRWCLRVFPGSGHKGSATTCNIYKVTDNENVKRITVNYEMTIIVGNGKHVKSIKGNKRITKDRNSSDTHFISLFEVLTNAIKIFDDDTLSISCVFATTNPIREQAIGCEASTEIGVKRCSFLWNVEEPVSSNRQSIKCPFPKICPIQITLISPEDDIDIQLHLEEEMSTWTLLVTCKIALLDAMLTERDSQCDKFLFRSYNNHGNREVWKFPSFIKKSQLENERDTFLKNGSFYLLCSFSSPNSIISNEIVKYWCDTISSTNVDSNSNKDTFPTLHCDLSAMLNTKEHSDIKLKTGTEIFPAHKCILAMRSPVFSAIFKQDMLENQTGVVDIPDVDAETLKSFLELLYTDSLSEINYDIVSRLLYLAEKYQVLLLKEKCANFLASSMFNGNVCAILRMADIFGHDCLKLSVINYIKEHSREIFPSEDWKGLIKHDRQLVTEVLYKFSEELRKAAK